MVKDNIYESIVTSLKELKLPETDFVIEHPADISHGDYSSNVALILSKKLKESPDIIAKNIVEKLSEKRIDGVESISIAGPGFINFFLSKKFFEDSLRSIFSQKNLVGNNNSLDKKKIVLEYTDPNPFKEFHIGHLMSNAIGESISRVIEANGAEVRRACYQGDVGMHVAQAIAYKLYQKEGDYKHWKGGIREMAIAYAESSRLSKEDESYKDNVKEINKKIYEKTDEAVNQLYNEGRDISLKYFDEMYKILGTKFDFYFFESTTGEFGKALVHENLKVFEKSDGAIVYRGEIRDPSLHTRVFINNEGLPTYEAKELGLAKIKYDTYPYDTSIVITGNEINDYFKVLLSAMGEIFPELADKTKHISHGMLRLPTGKMSSRTGEVITAESLINEAKEKVREKIDASDRGIEDKEKLAEEVAVGAIKYSILRQSPGKDIIFDFETSLSFEGDSGPYLQYTHARAHSLISKYEDLFNEKVSGIDFDRIDDSALPVIKILSQFSEVVASANEEFAPHKISSYLISLASTFNTFYGNNLIVDEENKEVSKIRIYVTLATANIIKKGLYLLGISAPERM